MQRWRVWYLVFWYSVFSFSGFDILASGFGFRILVFGFRVSGFGIRVSGFGFWYSGFGFRVSEFGFTEIMQGWRSFESWRISHAKLRLIFLQVASLPDEYWGTSRIRTRNSLEPYRRPLPRLIEGS